MRKIPTLFVRDENDRRYVTDEVTPGCEWVLAGEGVATRKYDGTCVYFDGDEWFARREVKPGKTPPPGFKFEQHDETTGKTVGWEPIEQSSFVKFWREAVQHGTDWESGTYELCGPKVNGNPERFEEHVLIPHATAEQLGEFMTTPWRDAATVRMSVKLHAGARGVEGIVWHHPDGRMAKIKARDYPDAA